MKNNLKLLIVALFLLTQTTLAQNWTQIGSDIDGEAEDDYSGESVSLSSDGKTVAIGAPDNDGNAGHVRIYKLETGASEFLVIDFGDYNAMAGYEISIFDFNAKEVHRENINSQNTQINLSNWSGEGLYLVNIIDPNGVTIESRKIVIQ